MGKKSHHSRNRWDSLYTINQAIENRFTISHENGTIEVGKSSLALGTCGEVEQCKAICRPVQAQIHLQHIADGTESDTVQAIIEAGGGNPCR